MRRKIFSSFRPFGEKRLLRFAIEHQGADAPEGAPENGAASVSPAEATNERIEELANEDLSPVAAETAPEVSTFPELSDEQKAEYLTFFSPTSIHPISPRTTSINYYEALGMRASLERSLKYIPDAKKNCGAVQTIQDIIARLGKPETRLAAARDASALCDQLAKYRQRIDLALAREQRQKQKQEFDEQMAAIQSNPDFDQADRVHEEHRLRRAMMMKNAERSSNYDTAAILLEGPKQRAEMYKRSEAFRAQELATAIEKVVGAVSQQASDDYLITSTSFDVLDMAVVGSDAGEAVMARIQRMQVMQQYKEFRSTMDRYRKAVNLITRLPNSGTVLVPEEVIRITGMQPDDIGPQTIMGGIPYRSANRPKEFAQQLHDRMERYYEGGKILQRRLLQQVEDIRHNLIPDSLEEEIYNQARLTESGEWRIKNGKHAREFMRNYSRGSNGALQDSVIDAYSTIRFDRERSFREEVADDSDFVDDANGDLLVGNRTMRHLHLYSNSVIHEQILQARDVYTSVDTNGNMGLDRTKLSRLRPEYLQKFLRAKQLQEQIQNLQKHLTPNIPNYEAVDTFTINAVAFLERQTSAPEQAITEIEQRSAELKEQIAYLIQDPNGAQNRSFIQARDAYVRTIQQYLQPIEDISDTFRIATLRKLREYYDRTKGKEPLVIQDCDEWSMVDIDTFRPIEVIIKDPYLTFDQVIALSKMDGKISLENAHNMTPAQIDQLNLAKADVSATFHFNGPIDKPTEAALLRFARNYQVKKQREMSLVTSEETVAGRLLPFLRKA